MSHGNLCADRFVVVRDDDQAIVGSTRTLEGAEAVRDAAERDSGEAHSCLPATRELAEAFTDWAWRTETIERDGIPTEVAVIDRYLAGARCCSTHEETGLGFNDVAGISSKQAPCSRHRDPPVVADAVADSFRQRATT